MGENDYSRVFGGKRYAFYGTYNKRSDAKRMANRFRDGGEPARIVYNESIKQYALYVRYGRGRGFKK